MLETLRPYAKQIRRCLYWSLASPVLYALVRGVGAADDIMTTVEWIAVVAKWIAGLGIVLILIPSLVLVVILEWDAIRARFKAVSAVIKSSSKRAIPIDSNTPWAVRRIRELTHKGSQIKTREQCRDWMESIAQYINEIEPEEFGEVHQRQLGRLIDDLEAMPVTSMPLRRIVNRTVEFLKNVGG